MSKKIAVLTEETIHDLEFWYPYYRLAEEGYDLVIVGPEAEGVFTLLNINFFLMGITMSCVGITGEYIGRIYQEVRKRPRYVIRREWNDE